MKPTNPTRLRTLPSTYICSTCRRRTRHTSQLGLQNSPRNPPFRPFTTTPHPPQQSTQSSPLGDFYTDLLSTPLPSRPSASSSAATSPTTTLQDTDSDLPDFVPTGRSEIEARARQVFGNIRSSGYESSISSTPDSTWRTINGVPVPPRPAEPDNCCMSGCVHCVWDDYRADVEGWAGRLHEAQAKGQLGEQQEVEGGRMGKLSIPRQEVMEASGSMDDDGGGSEGLWTTPSNVSARKGASQDELFQEIPVGIREFMATEKRIREWRKKKHLQPF